MGNPRWIEEGQDKDKDKEDLTVPRRGEKKTWLA
jgi:hypothetical protein